MKAKGGVITFLVVLSVLLARSGGSPAPGERQWSSGTAYTLPEGRLEMGLFQPLRKGQSDNVEWSTHPVLFLQIPNVVVKISHRPIHGWGTATRHSLVYPTPLLRRLRIKGFGIQALSDMDVGGIITSDPDVPQIPHMISSRNEIILSRNFGPSILISGKAGIALAIRGGELDDRTTIDLPVVFPRLGVFYNGYGLNFGLDILRRITKRLNYLVNGDILLLPGSDENFAFEHKGLFIWTKSERFRMVIGYKLVFGEYPFGTQWHLLPLFDLQWGWEGNR
ncbi:MAG: hypothetical protein ACE5GH_02905 [Fidelibacterota bacterium]